MSRENVIKGLEELYGFLFREYSNIPAEESKIYYERTCAIRDALALLKEQEAVEPKYYNSELRCGVCGHVVLTYCFDQNKGEVGKVMANFCPSCGRKVKWE